MKNKLLLFLLFLSVSVMFFEATSAAIRAPFSESLRESPGQEGAFYTGRYNNLFSQLLGKSETESDEKIDTAFQLLFFGNDSTRRVYYPDKSDSTMAYIEDIGNGDVRTEGMSYGMMIAVQMDGKDVFDRLWKWAKTHMQFKDGPHAGYFGWHCQTDGSIIDSSAASDGEE